MKNFFSGCRYRGTSTTAFGYTGQTYSQLPQPLQSSGLILTPTPGISRMALGLQLSTQAMQPQLRARQRSLKASARKFGCGSFGGVTPGDSAETAGIAPVRVSARVSAVLPRENKPCLKKSLREMPIITLCGVFFPNVP